MSYSLARLRANKAWRDRQKEKSLCVHGCGTSVKGEITIFGKPRTSCVKCTKKKNQRYTYKSKIQRASIQIKRLKEIVKRQAKIIGLQHQRIEELKNGKSPRQKNP